MASNVWSFAGENERTHRHRQLEGRERRAVDRSFRRRHRQGLSNRPPANQHADSGVLQPGDSDRRSQVAVALADAAAPSQLGVGHNLE